MTPDQVAAAQDCLRNCYACIQQGGNEASLRSVVNTYLPKITGEPTPWWAEEHSKNTEVPLKVRRNSQLVTVRADNLVGLTAIEYERNLTSQQVFQQGLKQVQEYMAGLLNEGAPPNDVRGILSDTVRWYAYEVYSINSATQPGHLAGSDINLHPVAVLPNFDGSAADPLAAQQLHQFLKLHLGRDAGQVLSAKTLCDMLGLESHAGRKFLTQAEAVVDAAFAADPDYADMVQRLWENFVSFVGTNNAQVGGFDRQAYVCELYLLTLAKLVAANVLKGQALLSSEQEIKEILNGQHFQAQGLTNLVEYDYFGWLTKAPHVDALIRLAQDIQLALKAFNFSYLLAEDLFGQLVSQLAKKTQRLLLGQVPTPSWLVKKMVDAFETNWPTDQPWRFVDPCCGSGAFIVEVISRRACQPEFAQLTREQQGQELGQVISGFDIDPLAVMLAKVSWLVAAKPKLQPFNSAFPVSIPIYHADSLFALTPLAGTLVVNAADGFDLNLDGQHIVLPSFLTSPEMQGFFDEFMDGLYRIARTCATSNPPGSVTETDVQLILTSALRSTATTLSADQTSLCESFGLKFAQVLMNLENLGRNGLWLHMLKNGYRPALMQGKFNGVVTNFPWLALSKLADNPYKDVLQAKMKEFGLKPVPQSVPHLELATIFLIHAAKHYLGKQGRIVAVVPNSVIQGTQHEPLRSGNFRQFMNGVQLQFAEVWDVDKKAFDTTNVAAVLVAEKCTPTFRYVREEGEDVTYPLYLSTLNKSNAWTKMPVDMNNVNNFKFQQGADIMPRTVWFHEVKPTQGPGGTTQYSIAPINASSQFYYLIQDSKQCTTFRATQTTISSRWVFEIYMSKHLLPFYIAEPALAVLPLQHRSTGTPVATITQAPKLAIAADRSANAHFQRVYTELSNEWCTSSPIDDEVFQRLNKNNKLVQQKFSQNDTLVVYGAGGQYPAAAKIHQLTAQSAARLIVDQTLYWMVLNDQDEADYLVGLINSEAVANAIRPFQPKGQQGARHIHTLVLSVIPKWDSHNPLHMEVVTKTRDLMSALATAVAADPTLQNLVYGMSSTQLHRRRLKLRDEIKKLACYATYEEACSRVV